MLIDNIIDCIRKTQQEQIYYKTLFSEKEIKDNENEFLFFLKPEITLQSDKIDLQKILSHILNQIIHFKFTIKDIRILSAAYMRDHKVISQHYGVINKLSVDAKKHMSDQAVAYFEQFYQTKVKDAIILGSLEFLQKYPCFNEKSLDHFWQNTKYEKLAGATYSSKVSIDGKTIYLVNGFHPRQLDHYIKKGHSIVCFTLTSNTDWSVARTSFIGSTLPDKAAENSLRHTLYKERKSFGLEEVSASLNGAHLSAGPIECLIELMRYNSNFSDKDEIKKLTDFRFGRMLIDAVGVETTEYLLTNPVVKYKNQNISVFDLTEEKNTTDAIEILKNLE